MPPRSKAQTRFMYAAAEGKIKGKDAPSKKVAREYLHDVPEGLPERAPGRKPLGKTRGKK